LVKIRFYLNVKRITHSVLVQDFISGFVCCVN